MGERPRWRCKPRRVRRARARLGAARGAAAIHTVEAQWQRIKEGVQRGHMRRRRVDSRPLAALVPPQHVGAHRAALDAARAALAHEGLQILQLAAEGGRGAAAKGAIDDGVAGGMQRMRELPPIVRKPLARRPPCPSACNAPTRPPLSPPPLSGTATTAAAAAAVPSSALR